MSRKNRSIVVVSGTDRKQSFIVLAKSPTNAVNIVAGTEKWTDRARHVEVVLSRRPAGNAIAVFNHLAGELDGRIIRKRHNSLKIALWPAETAKIVESCLERAKPRYRAAYDELQRLTSID